MDISKFSKARKGQALSSNIFPLRGIVEITREQLHSLPLTTAQIRVLDEQLARPGQVEALVFQPATNCVFGAVLSSWGGVAEFAVCPEDPERLRAQ